MGRKNYSKFFKNEETEVNNDTHVVPLDLEESVINAGGEVMRVETTEEPVVQNVASFAKGVVSGCKRLYVRKASNKESAYLCILDEGTEVTIELDAPTTEDFYKVCTTAGIEGYCMKKFISVK